MSANQLQAFFLVSDDIMDASITRRGQPCWYRQPSIGMIAINDGFMLESAIYHLIKVHFRSEPFYADLVDLFHETTYQTEMGQLIDLITAPEDKVDLSKFSLERHRLIVVYKTAYYSFYLPVACAMLLSRIPESYAVPRFLSSVLTMSLYRFSSLSGSTSRSKTTSWTLLAHQNRSEKSGQIFLITSVHGSSTPRLKLPVPNNAGFLTKTMEERTRKRRRT
jgi:hypothetical protein